jgi:hypothetical protein
MDVHPVINCIYRYWSIAIYIYLWFIWFIHIYIQYLYWFWNIFRYRLCLIWSYMYMWYIYIHNVFLHISKFLHIIIYIYLHMRMLILSMKLTTAMALTICWYGDLLRGWSLARNCWEFGDDTYVNLSLSENGGFNRFNSLWGVKRWWTSGMRRNGGTGRQAAKASSRNGGPQFCLLV